MLLKTILITTAALVVAPLHDTLPDLAIGATLPAADRKMQDVTGKEYSLKDLNGKNGLLVIFSCNTCPFVIGSEGSEGWEGRYPALGKYCKENGVGIALVNSNEAKRTDGDGFKDMQLHYRAKGYVGNYLMDVGSEVADAFGARTTPHVFLFDKNMKLVYKGAVDDNVDSARDARQHYLQDALNALVGGRTIDPATTRNLGCSIKRVPHEH